MHYLSEQGKITCHTDDIAISLRKLQEKQEFCYSPLILIEMVMLITKAENLSMDNKNSIFQT